MKKIHSIIYWVATLWLALGMFSTGMVQLLHQRAEGAIAPPGVYGIKHLGYPVSFLTIIGTWKILGVIAILIPGFKILKEWAYAGFFFLMTGAIFAHIASSDPLMGYWPSILLLVLTLISWYYRPDNRKILLQNQKTTKHE